MDLFENLSKVLSRRISKGEKRKMSFLSFFSPTRIVTGFILTSFVIYPTLSDPAGTIRVVSEFIGKITPIITGGV